MASEQNQKIIEFLQARQQAYRLVFDPENEFVKTVMGDLENFCRAKQSTFHTDARVHALVEGRREVYLRIKEYMDLTPEQLWLKYGKET